MSETPTFGAHNSGKTIGSAAGRYDAAYAYQGADSLLRDLAGVQAHALSTETRGPVSHTDCKDLIEYAIKGALNADSSDTILSPDSVTVTFPEKGDA